MRLTDEELTRLTESKQDRIRALAEECLQARERGLMPTVDLAAQLSANRLPTDMADGAYVPIVDGGLSVCAWTPEEGGKGKTTQVHLVMDMGHVMPGLKVVSRMKSGPGVDVLIRLLAEYRSEVWPSYRGVRVG